MKRVATRGKVIGSIAELARSEDEKEKEATMTVPLIGQESALY